MRHPLFDYSKPRSLAALVIATGLLFSVFGKTSALAHEGCEGVSGGSAITAVAGGTAGVTLHGHTSKKTTSESIWANMLLPMAYERDVDIQKYLKRQNRMNAFTFLTIGGVSAMGLAQSIVGLNTMHGQEHIPVEMHEDGEGHVHLHGDSKIPATMSIVSSGLTLATLGGKYAFDQLNGRKIVARQLVIKEQIEGILSQLKSGEPYAHVSAQLAGLIGPVATEEFEAIWTQAHPTIVTRPDADPPVILEHVAE